MIDWILNRFGYVKSDMSHISNGCNISSIAQAELDYIYEKTGFHSHKISHRFSINACMKTYEDKEARNIELLMRKYTSDYYVFTNDEGLLIGNICTITTKQDRVKNGRSNIKLVTLE